MSGRIVIGLILIVLGAFLLLDQLGVADFGAFIADWWPLALVAIGVAQWFRSPRNTAAAVVLVALGLLLLLSSLYDLSFWAVAWPLVIVAIGVWLILGRELSPATSDADTVSLSAVFGGVETVSNARNLKGGSLTAFCGGIVLDLHQATLAMDGAKILATAAFGGIEVKVPRGWRVAVDGSPIFGGFENSTDPENELADSAPRLTIKASVLFGALEVNNKR
jgi:predicted membrane protein